MPRHDLVVSYGLVGEVVADFADLKLLVEGWHRDLPGLLVDAGDGVGEIRSVISRGVEDFRISWQVSCSALALSAGIIAGNADNVKVNLMDVDADQGRYCLPLGGGS